MDDLAQRYTITWLAMTDQATGPADPAWPEGCHVDVALDALQTCRIGLPWPAAQCGRWVVTCGVCGLVITVAATGRHDDPRSVRVPCRLY